MSFPVIYFMFPAWLSQLFSCHYALKPISSLWACLFVNQKWFYQFIFSRIKYMVDWKVKAESTNDMSGRVLWDAEQSGKVNFRLSECRPTLFDIHKGPVFSENHKYLTVDKRSQNPVTVTQVTEDVVFLMTMHDLTVLSFICMCCNHDFMTDEQLHFIFVTFKWHYNVGNIIWFSILSSIQECPLIPVLIWCLLFPQL